MQLACSASMISASAAMSRVACTLSQLGLTHHFPNIFDIIKSQWQPKPEIFGHTEIVRRLGVGAGRCCTIEDTAANLLLAFS